MPPFPGALFRKSRACSRPPAFMERNAMKIPFIY